MKAIVYHQYGLPDVLKLEEVTKPVPKDNEVLLKVQAVSLNYSDWEFLTAKPAYVRVWGPTKPKQTILGSDIAGWVEAIGHKVKSFKPGDAVYGDIFERWGGLAEYVCAPEKALLLKPDSMSFEQASALPQAGVVALQGLRDKGQIKSGQKVLINGAGGGAGTFAIQLAKYYGAEVTAVDNSEKQQLMGDLGADHVNDYSLEDFTSNGQRYNLILDLKAAHSVFDYKRSLAPKGRYVLVGGSVPALLNTLFMGSMISITSGKKMGILAHKQNRRDMTFMTDLFEAGKVLPVIDKTYPLDEAPIAFARLGTAQALGKLVITL